MFTYKFSQIGQNHFRLYVDFLGGGTKLDTYQTQRIMKAIQIMNSYEFKIPGTFMNDLNMSFHNDRANDILNCFKELEQQHFLDATNAELFLEAIIIHVNHNRNRQEL